MTKFFCKLKKKQPIFAHFWPFSQIFGGESFPKKSGSATRNLIRISSTILKFRETLWPNSKKTPQLTAGLDGQTLFHRMLLATDRGLTNTTAVDWQLTVKDIEYDVNLTKTYCLTVSMQEINWINKLNL